MRRFVLVFALVVGCSTEMEQGADDASSMVQGDAGTGEIGNGSGGTAGTKAGNQTDVTINSDVGDGAGGNSDASSPPDASPKNDTNIADIGLDGTTTSTGGTGGSIGTVDAGGDGSAGTSGASGSAGTAGSTGNPDAGAADAIVGKDTGMSQDLPTASEVIPYLEAVPQFVVFISAGPYGPVISVSSQKYSINKDCRTINQKYTSYTLVEGKWQNVAGSIFSFTAQTVLNESDLQKYKVPTSSLNFYVDRVNDHPVIQKRSPISIDTWIQQNAQELNGKHGDALKEAIALLVGPGECL